MGLNGPIIGFVNEGITKEYLKSINYEGTIEEYLAQKNDTEKYSSIRTSDTLFDAISRVLGTVPGERMGNPEFGSNIKTFFFDPENIPIFTIENEIKYSLERWIPYIEIISMSSYIEDGVYYCDLEIQDNSSNETFNLTVNFD